jgi:hypothetical protein
MLKTWRLCAQHCVLVPELVGPIWETFVIPTTTGSAKDERLSSSLFIRVEVTVVSLLVILYT